MNQQYKNWFNSQSWHTIYLTLIFICTSVIIYFALPQEGRFRYEFQKGRPWMHSTLIAPFDFAIKKTDQTLKLERDSLLKSLSPYVVFRDTVGKEKIKALSAKIDEITLKENTEILYPRIVKNKVITLFEKIYLIGILEQTSGKSFSNTNGDQVIIIRNNIAEPSDTKKLYSLKTAYAEIAAALELLKSSDPDLKQIIQKFQAEDYLAVNLTYDQEKIKAEKLKILENLTTTHGVVQEGERIISKGDVVSSRTYLVLESLRSASEKNRGDFTKYYLIIIGKAIFIGILLLTLFLFIFNIRRNLLNSKRDITFTLAMMVVMILFCRIIISSSSIPIYLVPFAALALIIRTFLDARLAIFVNTITAIIVGFMVPNGYEFILLTIPVGSIAVISQNKLQRRSQLILTSIIIFVVYAITYVGISLIQEANLSAIDWNMMKWFAINAALTLITYLLVFVIEKTFGFVSDVTLIELSYSNQKLLRRLAEEAPGTFQHSMQVANLAEEAILRLGGNPLLVRAGALYHDIGKLRCPMYFIENQSIGSNPHDQLTAEESSKIILEHVEYGIELAHKHKIPEQLIDFIKTHHGTTVTSYYYVALNNNPGQDIDQSIYTYNGPIPSTKETAVVMLADSIEAASRSLTKRDHESFTMLIESIFQSKIKAGQLENAPLTFKDISQLKGIFLEKLLNIYHVRSAYPKKED
ncbi:MAG: HDIG domain-containing protein [Bacteroidia bacterium]|nr:HDIG domain-containing protein [Bacteroidia bacterium]